ncbi:hypothetical protein ACQ4M4_01475 [Leptolyngbya sp. AN02str]|uniref:hypothetical protein n=1 Tax=Leptolyngbya sp. AN02str TaxID=3423363 RepID=UPI003D31A218
MPPLVSCPTCARSLGRFTADGLFQASCPSCNAKYEGIFGRLSHHMAKREPLLYLSEQLPKYYRRRYELRIATPGRQLKQLSFSTPNDQAIVPVRQGDRIAVIYSTKGHALDRLLAIHNHSLGKLYQLPQPIAGKRSLWQTGGLSAAIAVGALFGGVDLGLVALGSMAIALSSRMTHIAELTTPPFDSDRPEEARLLSELKLVQQKAALHQRIEELRQESEEQHHLIRQLQALRNKMMRFNASLYASRVNSIETATRLLHQRIDHNHKLSEQYLQAIGMIDIELDASNLGEQLPDVDDFTNRIFERLDELKAIEAQNQDFWYQLQAHAEVRRLHPMPES